MIRLPIKESNKSMLIIISAITIPTKTVLLTPEYDWEEVPLLDEGDGVGSRVGGKDENSVGDHGAVGLKLGEENLGVGKKLGLV